MKILLPFSLMFFTLMAQGAEPVHLTLGVGKRVCVDNGCASPVQIERKAVEIPMDEWSSKGLDGEFSTGAKVFCYSVEDRQACLDIGVTRYQGVMKLNLIALTKGRNPVEILDIEAISVDSIMPVIKFRGVHFNKDNALIEPIFSVSNY